MIAPVLTDLRTDHRTDPSYRPYQPFGSAEKVMYCHDAEVLLSGPAGTGKALDISTELLTLSGWKTMGTVEVGDYVFHPSGIPVEVTEVSDIFTDHDCYEMEFSDHSVIISDSAHEWSVDLLVGGHRVNITKPTKWLSERILQNIKGYYLYSIHTCSPLEYPNSKEELTIDPYVFGYWLGDGASAKGVITTMDEEVVNYIKDNTSYIVVDRKKIPDAKSQDYSIKDLFSKLMLLGVAVNSEYEKGTRKHIPRIYLEASFEQRLELLRGLMDSDGSCSNGTTCSFTNINERLCLDAFELVTGLGIKCHYHEGRSTNPVKGSMNKERKDCGPIYGVNFTTDLRVFNLKRKYERQQPKQYRSENYIINRRNIIRITSVDPVPARCIKVGSEDGLFLAGRSLITTHNSRAVLEKLNLCACKYPGMRGLIVRKTRESITQSAMVTLEKFVIPQNGGVHFRTSEQEYRFQNGSTIVLGGMDRASKILSSEYDMIYCQQIEELDVEDYETLITRNRLGTMPYNQIIGDCNPSYPKHWLKQKADAGLLTYINSIHEDNPILYDHAMKQWTPRGIDYIKKLDGLTGVRKKRLRYGLWAAAEGIIFDEWQSPIHLINHFDPPDDWIRLWVVDFGFTAPLVWQAWALDEENDIAYMFAEIYHTKLLVEDAAAQIKAWRIAMHEQIPTAIICDHDAEGRETLVRHLDIETEAADKAISDGIQSVKTRMRLRENGKPGLYIMRDSLLDVDTELDDSGKPICTIDEIDSYEWQDPKRKDREGPRQVDDHGMDAMRYFCKYLEGEFGGWSQGMGG